MGDISFNLGKPAVVRLRPQTKIGVRGTYRTLDRYSNRYMPAGYRRARKDGELYPEDAPRRRGVGDQDVPAPGHLVPVRDHNEKGPVVMTGPSCIHRVHGKVRRFMDRGRP